MHQLSWHPPNICWDISGSKRRSDVEPWLHNCIFKPSAGLISIIHLASKRSLGLICWKQELCFIQQQQWCLPRAAAGGSNWCKVSECWDTNSRLELKPLLHKHLILPWQTNCFWNSSVQHASTDCTIFPCWCLYRSPGGSSPCLPSVDWISVGSASSDAMLVPGWGSTLTLFTFWKTQDIRITFTVNIQHISTLKTYMGGYRTIIRKRVTNMCS